MPRCGWKPLPAARRPLFSQLSAKLSGLPQRLEGHLASLDTVDEYWRRLALRFNSMVRLVVTQTRTSIEDQQLLVNVLLPLSAAHNLIAATELTLVTSGSAGDRSEVSPATMTIDDMLELKMSLVIPQQSLEFCLRDLAIEVNEAMVGLPYPFQIVIAGSDLQQEGITRNQQIRDFRGEQQTVSELLTL